MVILYVLQLQFCMEYIIVNIVYMNFKHFNRFNSIKGKSTIVAHSHIVSYCHTGTTYALLTLLLLF